LILVNSNFGIEMRVSIIAFDEPEIQSKIDFVSRWGVKYIAISIGYEMARIASGVAGNCCLTKAADCRRETDSLAADAVISKIAVEIRMKT
jgi:hypothetical protein